MIIETDNLTKMYGKKAGCREINLSVGEGQIFGFLGPNGAGKSTLVKMLVGLLFPTSGTARILGKPLGDLEIRRKVGFLPENFRYQDWLTGEELLTFHASLYKMSRAEKARRVPEVLEQVGLADKGRQKVGSYSKGMQQRVGLACALLPDPELVFLDEPTSALDPLGRREVRQIMVELRDRGKTVFLNSHLLSEIEMICDRVAIINKGRIITEGALAELLAGAVEVEMQVEGLSAQLLDELSALYGSYQVEGGLVRLSLKNNEDIPALAEAVVRNGGKLFSLNARQNSLEDLFIDLVKVGDEECLQ
ncbi:ABC transporter ATP-binding protein [Pelotomaculum propionicicum]|uniref:Putative ABC transporter ATP-binding protein YxlF n=1 Tax=Pelotomaculum propionicicum TaxID=258475 RepID=A0A4Y7RS19_9FIRM|nr:ABC transporter ATP-binding protein [Pelotomaculum propionicicum]TEB11482.1 putative ABC transporter ATP-binding protein YxlF [Pelotomaculum propionicicum]